MKLRLTVFALMLLGLPVFWLFEIPHYLYFLSGLLAVIVVQSAVYLVQTRQRMWWIQTLFFALVTALALFFAG